MLNAIRNKFAQATVATTLAILSVSEVLAQTAPTDATTQIQTIVDKQAGYLTVMFALALAGVGIMVGVKWIKRARGAA